MGLPAKAVTKAKKTPLVKTSGVFCSNEHWCYIRCMTQTNIKLPEHKRDTKRAKAIIRLGYPKVEPVLPVLMEWMQDINWPVAQTLQPFLASIGAPLAPYVRSVWRTDDDLWKYWVIICIVAESSDLTVALLPELERLALEPSEGECDEKIDIVAQNILRRFKNGTNESVLPEAYRSTI
jgi:hypothetical protein